MIPDKKNSYRHLANRRREIASDFDQTWAVKYMIRQHFKLEALTDEIVMTPKGRFPFRKPDLFIKARYPQIVIELDGEGVHGFGDRVSETHRDSTKYEDYATVKNLVVVRINSALTNGYQEDLVIGLQRANWN